MREPSWVDGSLPIAERATRAQTSLRQVGWSSPKPILLPKHGSRDTGWPTVGANTRTQNVSRSRREGVRHMVSAPAGSDVQTTRSSVGPPESPKTPHPTRLHQYLRPFTRKRRSLFGICSVRRPGGLPWSLVHPWSVLSPVLPHPLSFISNIQGTEITVGSRGPKRS